MLATDFSIEKINLILMESVEDYAIIILDTNGDILSWNTGAERINGYKAKEIIGQNFSCFYPAEAVKDNRPQKDLLVAKKTGRFAEESCRVRKDGSQFWASVVITALHNEKGELIGYGEITRDLSEREHADEALRQSEERVRLIIDSTQEYAILMLDHEGKILTWNIGAEQIKGYKANEIIGHNFSCFYTQEAIKNKQPQKDLELAKKTGRFAEEGWRVHKDGSQFWASVVITALYNEKKQLIGFGEIARDLSESKNAVEALRQSEERVRLIIDSTQEYAILMLDPDGKIMTWNIGAEQIIGYKANEIIGNNFSCFYTEEAIKAHRSKKDLEVAKKTGRLAEEGWRARKDGSVYWASIVITALHNENGKLVGFGTIARDLTESKKIETMKNEFISIVSHELRTPLTSIQGSLSLLVDGNIEKTFTPKTQNLLRIAKQNSERLIRLINDILDIEKIESGNMEFLLKPIKLAALLKKSVEANKPFGHKFGVGIKLLNIKDCTVNADSDRLLQVMANLISNAIKFSLEGGSIEISTTQQNKKVRVSIKNEGEGIPKDFQSKIFQKFAQADSSAVRQKGGTGLGLSISKEIIAKLNGTIGFITSETGGTTFYFELPIVDLVIDNIQSFERIKTILICEGNEDTSTELSLYLENNNFNVITTNNVTDAKKVLAEQEVDALLLDLAFSDEDGILLLREIRTIVDISQLPIIVISIRTEVTQSELNSDAGAFTILDWINKPYERTRIFNAIELLKQHISGKTPKILHIEDNEDVAQIIADLFRKDADIVNVTTLELAKDEINKNRYDLVILDLMLPDGSALEILPILSKKHIPIIVFSAYELPKDYSNYVIKNLVKTKTSPYELLEAIKSSLQEKNLLG